MSLRTIKGIGPSTEEKLNAAGIKTPEQLAVAEADSIADKTGLSDVRLKAWIKDAKKATGASAKGAPTPKAAAKPKAPTAKSVRPPAATKAKAVVSRSLESADHARIVLMEGMERARVKVQNEIIAEVPILTAKAKENAEAKLAELQGNVIVLRERTDTALLRLEEQIYEGVPLFKEKLDDSTDEVRVRVREIRDKRLQPAFKTFGSKIKGLFGRE